MQLGPGIEQCGEELSDYDVRAQIILPTFRSKHFQLFNTFKNNKAVENINNPKSWEGHKLMMKLNLFNRFIRDKPFLIFFRL